MDHYTPRERMVLMTLNHAKTPLTLAELSARAQYKTGYPLRTLLRNLIRAGLVAELPTASPDTSRYYAVERVDQGGLK